MALTNQNLQNPKSFSATNIDIVRDCEGYFIRGWNSRGSVDGPYADDAATALRMARKDGLRIPRFAPVATIDYTAVG